MQLKTAKEVAKDVLIEDFDQSLEKRITQDRADIRAVLEGEIYGMYQVWIPDDKAFMEHGTTERLDNEYNQALDDTLTIINSIFKE